MVRCPNCATENVDDARYCASCGHDLSGAAPAAAGTPTNMSGATGTQSNGKATASLVCGIVGLVFCGIILGILAIVFGQQAKKAIADNPNLGGAGAAQAGLILGVVDIVLGVGFLVFYLPRMGG